MKKTCAEMNEYLLDFFGLEIGDRIMLSAYDNKIYRVVIAHEGPVLKNINDTNDRQLICWLREEEYEIIAGPKRIGDRRCGEETTQSDCDKCPLCSIQCAEGYPLEYDGNRPIESLYEVLNRWAEFFDISEDNPIYLAYKAELDKEEEYVG